MLEEIADIASEMHVAVDTASTWVWAVMNDLRAHLFSEAYAYFENWVANVTKTLQAAAPINLVGSGMNVVVNVYGTKDIFVKWKIGEEAIAGYRTEIGRYRVGDTVRPLVNIEIAGAGHGDYIRGGGGLVNPVEAGLFAGPVTALGVLLGNLRKEEDRAWNERVANFVADMVGHSQTEESLKEFLGGQARSEHLARIEEVEGKWIIKLPGWEARQ